jgi:hypothetical protein
MSSTVASMMRAVASSSLRGGSPPQPRLRATFGFLHRHGRRISPAAVDVDVAHQSM